MSPSVDQRPESLLEQARASEDLDAQIIGIRQLIAALQSELGELEERRRTFARQQTLVTPFAGPRPTANALTSVSWKLWMAALVSLVFSFGGQFILLKTNRGSPEEGLRQAIAGGMLIAGALLFGALMPRVSGLLSRLEFPISEANSSAFDWRNPWNLGWLSAAVLLAAFAILLFNTLGESLAVVLIWLFSILALFIAQLRGMRLRRPHIMPKERIYLAGLVVLLAITLVTRIYHLTTLPYNFDGDFASVGLQARALLTGEQKHIFAYGWAAIPMLGYLPSWLSMSLFGNNLTGLNASGVIEGLLTIVGVYLLGRDLFHARVGLIAAALLTISYTHLAASRQSVYIDPVFVLVFAIYFLFLGLRQGRGAAIVASGVFTAFCMQVYYPSRIVVFIVGFMLLYLLLFRRKWLKTYWWGLSLWGLAVLVVLGPMLVVFLGDINGFMSRTREVFILNPELIRHSQGVYHVETVRDILLEQARRSVLMFYYYNDTSTQFGISRPFLDPFTAPLFTLGIGYALFNLRRFGAVLLLVWTVTSVIVGCFLTGNPPFWARLLVLLPPTALLAALALDVIYELTNRSLESMGSWARVIAQVAIVLCLIVVGVRNWNTYVELKGTYATARTFIARYLADQPPTTRAYLISNNYTYRDREFDFLIPGRLVANLTPEQAEQNIAPVGEPTMLIVTAEQGGLMQRLEQLFPNGSTEIHTGNSPNEVAFYVVKLP